MLKLIIILLIVIISFLIFLILEAKISMLGKKEKFTNPERTQVEYGNSGEKIKFVIMGDSTGAGQGANYEKGIAVSSAVYLSKNRHVTLTNISISGAKVKDVFTEQLKVAITLKPDIVLIAVGANDVTHLTPLSKIKTDLHTLISELISSNCEVKIILTASPDMGAPPRILQPLRFLSGIQTLRVNAVFYDEVKKLNLTLAPIQKETGNDFRNNPSLFASDRFHPNEKGYSKWNKVIQHALDEAIKTQTTHCQKKSS